MRNVLFFLLTFASTYTVVCSIQILFFQALAKVRFFIGE